ncbi:hypothetical protein [Prauserella cavernicola]|uniref:Uncharacterized protein n=1 Tax=Prauserella cavernicola TaxID=2800127 RepID=A0A934QSI5_9PSEU|nr:hypothetical protein [Prauserella cavernicola]MBK1785522.1 hypothetical protein [Prauserella cavernicola]
MRYVVSLGLLLGGMAVLTLLQDGDLGFLNARFWPLWLIPIVGAYLMSNPFNIDTVSAGADWVQWSRSRLRRTNHLKTYELTKIRTSYGGGDLYLDLYDDERGMSRTFAEWHRDRRIWDLVYNGIVHSVAGGADIRPQDIGVLKLTHHPALRARAQRDKKT